jgi:hypothetical protein
MGLGQPGALGGVKLLDCSFESVNPSSLVAAGALGGALAAGAFASLETLQFKSFLGDADLGALVPGLRVAPCAQTLRVLKLVESGISGGAGFELLAEAIAGGAFPSLVELNLGMNPLEDAALEAFAASLSAARPLALEVLLSDDTAVGNAGIKALASALREGHLGARLWELRFEKVPMPDEPYHVSDAAAHALAEAFAGGREYVKHLQLLSVDAPGMTVNGIMALVESACLHCPEIEKIVVSKNGGGCAEPGKGRRCAGRTGEAGRCPLCLPESKEPLQSAMLLV